MENATFMRIMNGLGDNLHITRRLRGRKAPVANQPGQIGTVHEIHYKIMLVSVQPHLMNGGNVRMLQTTRGRSLGAEPADLIGGGQGPKKNHFYRHQSVQTNLPRLVNHAHTAASDFLQKLVIAKSCRRGIKGIGVEAVFFVSYADSFNFVNRLQGVYQCTAEAKSGGVIATQGLTAKSADTLLCFLRHVCLFVWLHSCTAAYTSASCKKMAMR